MKERRNTQPLVVRCKLVLVGDVQCGKTAMLQVLAKDCYPEVRRQSQYKYLIYFFFLKEKKTNPRNAADELGSLLYNLSPVGVCACLCAC